MRRSSRIFAQNVTQGNTSVLTVQLVMYAAILHMHIIEQYKTQSSCIDSNNAVVVWNMSENTHKNENQLLKTCVRIIMNASTHGPSTRTSTSTTTLPIRSVGLYMIIKWIDYQ